MKEKYNKIIKGKCFTKEKHKTVDNIQRKNILEIIKETALDQACRKMSILTTIVVTLEQNSIGIEPLKNNL